MKNFLLFLVLLPLVCHAQNWEMNYGGTAKESITGMCNAKGGFLLCGFTTDNNYSTGILRKIDSFGNEIWKKVYDTTVSRGLYAIAPDSEGGFVGVGQQGDYPYTFYLRQVDSLGNLKKDVVTSYSGKGNKIIPLSAGGFIVIVTNSTPTGANHILKFNQDLILQWDHAVPFDYWNVTKFYDIFTNLCEDSNGNVLVSGSHNWSVSYPGGWLDSSYIFIDQLNSAGAPGVRHKYFVHHNSSTGGTPIYSGGGYMTKLDDGNILLAGYVDEVVQLVKLTPAFVQIYNHTYEPPSGYGISAVGNAEDTGAFILTVKYDNINLTQSVILDEFNIDGNHNYTLPVETSKNLYVTAAVRTDTGCFIAVGYEDSTGNEQFDPYAWGICSENTGVNEVLSESDVYLFPNPASLYQQLKFENLPQGKWEITAYTISGTKIFAEEVYGNQPISVAGHFTPGLFIISVKNQNDASAEHIFKLVVTPENH